MNWIKIVDMGSNGPSQGSTEENRGLTGAIIIQSIL